MTERAAAPLAVVTGASQGLGETIARHLGREGHELLLTARRPGPLEDVVRSLRDEGVVAQALPGDVRDPMHREAVRQSVSARALDILVNNASDLGPSPLPALVDYPLDAFEQVLRTNTVAPLALVQSLRAPLELGRGLVVNISSDAGQGGYPGWGGYGASKAALDLVSLTLAHELAAQGIAVVSVDPGDMRTAMHQAAYAGQDIRDRPEPAVTLPFWAWLFHQDRLKVTGGRFRAQADRWEVPAP